MMIYTRALVVLATLLAADYMEQIARAGEVTQANTSSSPSQGASCVSDEAPNAARAARLAEFHRRVEEKNARKTTPAPVPPPYRPAAAVTNTAVTKDSGKVSATSTESLTENTQTTDSCPLNKGFVPLQELPDSYVCSSKNQDAFRADIFDRPDSCPVPIGYNGERMYHWLPKGKSLDSRRAQKMDAGLNPDTWAPWTHRPVCADKGKYCAFSNAAIKALPVGAEPEIVVRESTPSLTDGMLSNTSTGANTTLFTPEKNALYNSKWNTLSSKYTDTEALFQGMSILTTPEMAAGDLHPNNFALDTSALAHFDYFATLPPSYKIQQIEDFPEDPYKETEEEDHREKALKEKKDKEAREEIKKKFLESQHKYAEADEKKSGNEDAEGVEPQDERDEDEEDGINPDPDDDKDDDGAEGDDFGDIVVDDDAKPGDSEQAAASNEYKGFTKEMKEFAMRNKNPSDSGKKSPVEHTSSKGWGAVADRDIKAGEPIIMERPALVAHDTLLLGGEDDWAVHGTHMAAYEDDHGLGLESVKKRAHLWQAMVDNLPPAAAARVRSLNVLPKYRADFQKRPDGLDALNKTSDEYISMNHDYRNGASQLSLEEKLFGSNALAIRINGYTLKGLFPHIAVLNHGCVPNTVMTWSEAPMAMVVYAKRDIKKGEELTVNYLDDDLNFKARAVMNGQRFNFKCQCDLCRHQRADPAARIASNNRRDLLKHEIPSIVRSAVQIGRLDLALQAYLVASKTLVEEGLRQPGTVREGDIGLFGGLKSKVAGASTQVPVADAFGPAGVTFEFGELLAHQGKLKESLPYLRAALVEIAWRSAGYMSEQQKTMQGALITLIDAIEVQIARRDRAKGGDGVSVLTKAKPSSQDVVKPTLDAHEIVAEINAVIDEIEKEEFLAASGRNGDQTSSKK